MREAAAGGHRGRLRAQALAFGAIRALSFLTIVVLGLILGFMLWRGLRYGNATRGPILPYTEQAPEGLVLVVNAKTKAPWLEFPMVQGLFSDGFINWAKITADDYDLLPLALDPATPAGAKVERFLFGPAPLWGGLVENLPDAASALARVAAKPGAVTIVPAADYEAFLKTAGGGAALALATVPLRRLSLALNPEVVALVDNRALEDLDNATIARLASGKVANWKELGGPDLPATMLAPPRGSPLEAAVKAAGYANSGSPAPDQDTLLADLGSRPGTAAFLFSVDLLASGLPTATRSGRESGWNLTLSYLLEEPRLSGKVGGISTIILNTVLMLLLTSLLAGPVGVAAAVYLVEYAKQGPLVGLLRLGTETLAGIPSIIFGLFGMVFFVETLKFGFGLLSGCLTLMIMILPTIVRTSEEALKAVSGGLREGSLALGATKLQTILRVVVPAAAPGILTGLILGIGRAVGETAALLFTMGSDYKLAKGLFSSARVLSSHVYLLFAEGISFDRAFSTATVLILLVFTFNFAARLLVGRMNKHAY